MNNESFDDQSIDFLFLFSTIRRRIWTIILGSMVVLVLVGIYVIVVPERFTATSKVLFDPVGTAIQTNTLNASIPRSRLEAEVEIARSESTFLRVIRDLDLMNAPEFQPQTNPLMEMYQVIFNIPTQDTDVTRRLNTARSKLNQATTVRQAGLSQVIQFEVETQSPELSAQLANALADAYIAVQLESKIQSTLSTLAIIQEATEAARQNLENSQSGLVGYLDENAAFIAEQTGNIGIGLLAADLKSGQETLSDFVAQQNRLRQLLAENDFDALGTELLSTLSDDLISSLQARAYQQAEARRRTLLEQRDSGNAPVDFAQQLAGIERELSDLTNERVNQIAQLSAEQQRDLASLSNQLESEIFTIDLPPAIAAELFSLQSAAQSARRQYSSLLDQTELVGIQTRTQIADSRVFAPAFPPNSASFPNRPLLLIAALFVGLILSITCVMIFEVYFGGFATGGQLRDYLDNHNVVEIPRFTSKDSIINLALTNPFSLPVEKMRAVRAMLELNFNKQSIEAQQNSQYSGRVIASMSSMPNEGKSTAVLGLGMVCASAGLRVCIVDFDFRRPQMAKRMGLEPNTALIEYLKSDQIMPTPQEFFVDGMETGIDVFTTDFDDQAVADQLFFDKSFSRFINDIRKSYDYVILDSAPVLSVAASRFILQVVDNVMFCVKANETNKRVVNDTYRSLGLNTLTGAKPVLLLTQTNSTDIGYYSAYQAYKSQ